MVKTNMGATTYPCYIQICVIMRCLIKELHYSIYFPHSFLPLCGLFDITFFTILQNLGLFVNLHVCSSDYSLPILSTVCFYNISLSINANAGLLLFIFKHVIRICFTIIGYILPWNVFFNFASECFTSAVYFSQFQKNRH